MDEVITVSVDQVCAAVKSIFEEVRATVEPAGALAVAGAIRYAALEAENSVPEGDWVALLSGANINFDRLGHIVERCALGEGTEALLVVTIPERAGSFLEFCRILGESSVTEFNYRFASESMHIYLSVCAYRSHPGICRKGLLEGGYGVKDLSDNEVAKLHMRHLVGGRLPSGERERLYRFEFPERPGALLEFLSVLAGRWSISLFHYRNHAAANARILAGFLVPAEGRRSLSSVSGRNRLSLSSMRQITSPAWSSCPPRRVSRLRLKLLNNDSLIVGYQFLTHASAICQKPLTPALVQS